MLCADCEAGRFFVFLKLCMKKECNGKVVKQFITLCIFYTLMLET